MDTGEPTGPSEGWQARDNEMWSPNPLDDLPSTIPFVQTLRPSFGSAHLRRAESGARWDMGLFDSPAYPAGSASPVVFPPREIGAPHRTDCGSIEADPGPVYTIAPWPPLWSRPALLTANDVAEVVTGDEPHVCAHVLHAERMLKDAGVSVFQDEYVDEDLLVRCHHCGRTWAYNNFGVPR